jgi:ABC-type multidrug transport system ATPase subunit
MIKVEKLSHEFNSDIILNDINFTIEKGKLAVIYGKNGAGKTTLIKCLVGLIKPTNGNINITPNNKKAIGVYLGHEMLIEKLTIREYLTLAGTLKGLIKDKIESKIIEFSQNLNFSDHLDKSISKISFGTKSKVLFVASIINDPEILIMDEPFVGMDLIAIKEVVNVLTTLKKNGSTLFISSHQVDMLETFIDQILILKNQKIILNQNIDNLNIKSINQLLDLVLTNLIET